MRRRAPWLFDADSGRRQLLRFFNLHDMSGFGLEDKPLSIAAAAALLGYVEETQKQRLPHLTSIAVESGDGAIAMNAATRRHLELDTRVDGDTRNTLLGKASQDPVLTSVRPNSLEDSPQLHLDVDRVQAQSMGLSVGDIYNAIGLMLAPVYVNDFTYGGRVKRVIMQADAPYRMGPDALQHIFTPGLDKVFTLSKPYECE